MALELRSRGVTLTLRDNNGKTASVDVNFPSTTSAADVVAAIPNVAPLIAALSDAAIIRASATFTYTETEPATPPPSSEIERKLVIIARAANGGIVRYSIPSASFNLETSGSNAVQLTLPAVAGFRTWALANAGSIVGSPITTFEKAHISHRYRKP